MDWIAIIDEISVAFIVGCIGVSVVILVWKKL